MEQTKPYNRSEQLDYIRDMQTELRAIRYHTQNFNRLCAAAGYVNDTLESDNLDDLQSNLTQEYNWLDV